MFKYFKRAIVLFDLMLITFPNTSFLIIMLHDYVNSSYLRLQSLILWFITVFQCWCERPAALRRSCSKHYNVFVIISQHLTSHC